mmetsp:Transcript_3667/g.11512  ORF Transcript_3667/g.11512 Transcript_3667/m.11512 type:complete len:462 (-) Transcript_3667:344-1729(-)
MRWKSTRVSVSFRSKGRRSASNCSSVSCGWESTSSVVLSSNARAKAASMRRKRRLIFRRSSSNSRDGSERPMTLRNSQREMPPELSTSISLKAFLASTSLKPRVRTALTTNSWRLMRSQRFMSRSKKAFSRLPPYFLRSRSRTSSRSSAGDTVATALASSPTDVVPWGSLQTMLKSARCSPGSTTLTLLSRPLNSWNVRRWELLAPFSSILLIAWLIAVKPEASHLRRRSSSVRTGAPPSTPMTNSLAVTMPRHRKSSCSKSMSHSSTGRGPSGCLESMRRHSRFAKPWGLGCSLMRAAKASSTVGKCSWSHLRKSCMMAVLQEPPLVRPSAGLPTLPPGLPRGGMLALVDPSWPCFQDRATPCRAARMDVCACVGVGPVPRWLEPCQVAKQGPSVREDCSCGTERRPMFVGDSERALGISIGDSSSASFGESSPRGSGVKTARCSSLVGVRCSSLVGVRG